ncbi:dienelactone hydrolase family protein [Candidatus Izimaplasma bacterium]|nr:dienelactone hydrolase family protein [Candidatus Izimaplasma bacterium]
MFVLEIFIYILSIAMLWILISKRSVKKPYVVSLLSITILFLMLHIILGGSRWQFYTLYGAILIIGILVYLKTIMNIILRNIVRISIIIVSSLLIVVSLGSVIVFPIYTMPTPSGDYLIGTESFIIEDESRYEMYSEDGNEFRKIKIQIWYPAETTDGYDRAPWLEDGLVVARALSKDTGLPSFVLDHAVNIMSNSYVEAPLSSALDDYPVIIISHGWRGFRNLHSDFAEELVSQGYIVIGIDHSYGSVATVFSDDDIAYLNLDALPERDTTPDFLDYANQLVNTYASDITATINYLEEINDSTDTSRFSEKLDLTNIGLLGHSTGGGGAVAVAINDDRIGAVIGLDAWVEPIDDTELDKGLTIPTLFIRSGAWETGYNNEFLYDLIENSTYPSDFYQIDGTTHYDFAMVYMYSPLTKLIGFTGEVESEYLTSILKSMMVDFFNETLNNDSSSEINPDDWEEVRVISFE